MRSPVGWQGWLGGQRGRGQCGISYPDDGSIRGGKIEGSLCHKQEHNRHVYAGLRGGKDNKKEELQGKLVLNNTGIKWGDRSAEVTNVFPFLCGMKAEVVSVEEAVALISQGVWWDGKRYEAELWKNERLRALGGSQGSGRGSPPSGPGGNRGVGGGYGGTEPRDTRPIHGLSNVYCYNCRGSGH